MKTRIKFCGLTRVEDVHFAVDLGIDAVGFVFTRRSQRFVGVSQARMLRRALPPFVMAVALFMDDDPGWIEEVIAAVQPDLLQFHGEEPPRIHVGAEVRDTVWVFTVKDNGIGLDTQYADRIFMMFQRLHNKAEYPGTGIGLAIVKKIVERHGGRIWVESKPGKGSSFGFTLARQHNTNGAHA